MAIRAAHNTFNLAEAGTFVGWLTPIGMLECSLVDVSSESRSRIILSLLTLACSAFLPGLANEQVLTCATDEYERTLHVLNHYRDPCG